MTCDRAGFQPLVPGGDSIPGAAPQANIGRAFGAQTNYISRDCDGLGVLPSRPNVLPFYLGVSRSQAGISPIRLGVVRSRMAVVPSWLGVLRIWPVVAPRRLGVSRIWMGIAPRRLGVSRIWVGIAPSRQGVSRIWMVLPAGWELPTAGWGSIWLATRCLSRPPATLIARSPSSPHSHRLL